MESLIERAARAASHPFVKPEVDNAAAGALSAINYDQYQSIRYRPERRLWRGEPGQFEVQFSPVGFHFTQPVAMHVVQHNDVVPFRFARDLFSYGLVPTPGDDADLGFSGLQVYAPLNGGADRRDEVLAFQGASDFWALGRGQVYGVSARVFALDLASARAEEFPHFTDFYLVRPGPADEAMWLLALLESEHSTGAVAFRVEPGKVDKPDTVIDVTARIFVREPGSVIGIAPLGGMFLFGEAEPARFRGFRPEVHNADGLALWAHDGERILRSLRNPAQETVCSFRLDSPRGFGLVQRDRAFTSYEDLDAHDQDRPSVWVEPIGDWGAGAVRLVEVPSESEERNNIAAAFVPDRVPTSGLALHYRLHFGGETQSRPAASWVTAVRWTDSPATTTPASRRFLVDFEGGKLATENGAGVNTSVVVSASRGRVIDPKATRNPYTGGIRASFEIRPEEGSKAVEKDVNGDIELRAFLRTPQEVLSETWSYLWQPKQ